MTSLNTIIEEEKAKNKAIAITVRLENEVFHGRFSSSILECIEKIIAEEITSAMQRAYEAGVEDSKFHVEDNCDWFNKNNPIPDEEFHKNFEHSEMLRGVVKATCDELKAKTLTHLDQLKKEIKELER